MLAAADETVIFFFLSHLVVKDLVVKAVKPWLIGDKRHSDLTLTLVVNLELLHFTPLNISSSFNFTPLRLAIFKIWAT